MIGKPWPTQVYYIITDGEVTILSCVDWCFWVWEGVSAINVFTQVASFVFRECHQQLDGGHWSWEFSQKHWSVYGAERYLRPTIERFQGKEKGGHGWDRDFYPRWLVYDTYLKTLDCLRWMDFMYVCISFPMQAVMTDGDFHSMVKTVPSKKRIIFLDEPCGNPVWTCRCVDLWLLSMCTNTFSTLDPLKMMLRSNTLALTVLAKGIISSHYEK